MEPMNPQPVKNVKPPLPVSNIARFDRFFRAAASLEVDKSDLERFSDFINEKVYDLLVHAQATAGTNGRDVIEPHDLPITKGLQESIHAFEKIDKETNLEPVLDRLAGRPELDLAYSYETEARLPGVVGGLSVALARAFTIIDPELKNPATLHWERAFAIFNLLL